MGNAASARLKGAEGTFVLPPEGSSRLQIVLVEDAAHPLYRNEELDDKTIRCGLGRTLESMAQYDPGVDVAVLIVINEASRASAASGARRSTRLLGPLQRWAERRRWRRSERRREMYAHLPQKYPFIGGVFFRAARGHDLAGYDFGYRLLHERGYRGDVLFMSTSVVGPHEHGWLAKYRGQFRRHPNVGLCGIGLNSHDTSVGNGPFAPHVQSYFLYTSMQVLSDAVGTRLLESDVCDEQNVGARGEIEMSRRVLDAGYSITSPVFPEFAYRHGDRWAIPRGDLRYCRRLRLPINAI